MNEGTAFISKFMTATLVMGGLASGFQTESVGVAATFAGVGAVFIPAIYSTLTVPRIVYNKATLSLRKRLAIKKLKKIDSVSLGVAL